MLNKIDSWWARTELGEADETVPVYVYERRLQYH
jgi:hypothetical protein